MYKRQPVSGANVNLNLNDTYINAISGEDGNAIIDLNGLSGQNGEVTVTVTCQDCVYSETSFSLNQDSIFPEVLGASILFDEVNASSNLDGFVNPGEQLSIDFYMTNFSGSSIENINVEIRSSELSLASENTINIQNIDIGQTVLVEDLISYRLNNVWFEVYIFDERPLRADFLAIFITCSPRNASAGRLSG